LFIVLFLYMCITIRISIVCIFIYSFKLNNSKPFLSVINSFLLWYRLSCVGNLLSAADTCSQSKAFLIDDHWIFLNPLILLTMLSYRRVIRSLFLPSSFFIEIRWYCHIIEQITDLSLIRFIFVIVYLWYWNILEVFLIYIYIYIYIYIIILTIKDFICENLLVNSMKITLILYALV